MSNASLPVGLVCKDFGSLTPPCQSAWFEKSTPWPPYQRAWCKLCFVVKARGAKSAESARSAQVQKAHNSQKTQKAPQGKAQSTRGALRKLRENRQEGYGEALERSSEEPGRLREVPGRPWRASGRPRETPAGLGRPQESPRSTREGSGRPREGPGRPRGRPRDVPGRPWGSPGPPAQSKRSQVKGLLTLKGLNGLN